MFAPQQLIGMASSDWCLVFELKQAPVHQSSMTDIHQGLGGCHQHTGGKSKYDLQDLQPRFYLCQKWFSEFIFIGL